MDDHNCEDFDGECYGWGWHAMSLEDDELFSPSELAQVEMEAAEAEKYSFEL